MKTLGCSITVALGIALAPAMVAQMVTVEAIPPSPNHIEASYRAKGDPNPKLSPKALVQHTDMVLPHIATGGGWETVVVIVNLSSTGLDFTQSFYDDYGRPMNVTLRTYPDGKLITTSATKGYLPAHASFNFSLFDSTSYTQVGWATLEYDSSKGRLGGYSAFRLKAGGVINEGLVPLSSYDDTEFMMPFDNLEGFATGLALCNPGANMSVHATILALDLNGNQIAKDTVTIPPSGHTAYVLTDRMPSLAGRTGTLVVDGDTTRLSAVGIRMNVAGGMTFTSIPVMNWIPSI